MEIIWTDEAYQSYEEIIDFLLLKWNNKVVQNFINEVEEKEDLIYLNHYIGMEFLNKYRKLAVGKLDILVYRVVEIEQKIIILYVWDGRKNPQILQRLLSY